MDDPASLPTKANKRKSEVTQVFSSPSAPAAVNPYAIKAPSSNSYAAKAASSSAAPANLYPKAASAASGNPYAQKAKTSNTSSSFTTTTSKPTGPPPGEGRASIDDSTNNEWKCPRCTLVNTSKRCDACGSSKPNEKKNSKQTTLSFMDDPASLPTKANKRKLSGVPETRKAKDKPAASHSTNATKPAASHSTNATTTSFSSKPKKKTMKKAKTINTNATTPSFPFSSTTTTTPMAMMTESSSFTTTSKPTTKMTKTSSAGKNAADRSESAMSSPKAVDGATTPMNDGCDEEASFRDIEDAPVNPEDRKHGAMYMKMTRGKQRTRTGVCGIWDENLKSGKGGYQLTEEDLEKRRKKQK
ncbi:hypothetical protein TrCOL_g7990, partial [Triparma columacea]